jgi:hypothetical protein
MRIFRNKPFTRFAKRAALDDDALCQAVDDAERGLINARLGSGVIKQRLARQGEGKSGGFRAIILYKERALAIFVHGFAKKDQDNIERRELAAFKLLASQLLSLDDERIRRAIEAGTLIEVVRSEED